MDSIYFHRPRGGYTEHYKSKGRTLCHIEKQEPDIVLQGSKEAGKASTLCATCQRIVESYKAEACLQGWKVAILITLNECGELTADELLERINLRSLTGKRLAQNNLAVHTGPLEAANLLTKVRRKPNRRKAYHQLTDQARALLRQHAERVN